MGTEENYRGYEKDLTNKGVKLVKRHVQIPEGCWMCGRRGVKMSKEHVIPEWVQKHYGISNQTMRQAHIDYKGSILSTREVKFASLRQGRVCKAYCNEGWMSKLEVDFKKVFTKGWKNGQAKDPIVFARWIAKTLTIINLSQPRRVIIDEAGRHELANKKVLPKRWRVYIYETNSVIPEIVTWEQGGTFEVSTKGNMTQKKKDISEKVFAGCIKVDNMVGVAYYLPNEVKDLAPIFPLKKLWPSRREELTTLPYGGLLSNQSLINIDLKPSEWIERVSERKKLALNFLCKEGIIPN